MKKLIKGCALLMAICFLLLGIVFKYTAENHRGISVSNGVVINGAYSEAMTGRIGENSEKFESFNTGATMFFVLAGIMGSVFIVATISKN